MTLSVSEANLSDRDVRFLIAYHQQDMLSASPPGTSFALDLSELSGADITFLGAWEDGCLVGIGALKRLDEHHAELKSMRTHSGHLCKGVARSILEELIRRARHEGISRLSLETGTNERFAPAIALYTRRGFEPGEEFADYSNGPHNQCYHLAL